VTVLHGKNTKAWFNEHDVGPYLSSIGLSGSRETADVTTFASGGNKEFIAGVRNTTVGAGGFHDAGFTEIDDAMDSGDGLLAWSRAPAPPSVTAPTSPRSSAPASRRSARRGAWSRSPGTRWRQAPRASGRSSTPKVEDTDATTGASKDDGAATATGWQAHLHVFAVDGGSWVISIEDSANNSAWSAVTGASFAAVTGAASERLVSASEASLRRYVRYKATRTRGSAGDGVTFGLA